MPSQTSKPIEGHAFHIPVMGTGFTVDTPVKVAHYGISSVVSIIDHRLTEEMRQHHCELTGRSFEPIPEKEEDSRAKRITAYLNLVNELVKENFRRVRESLFEKGGEIVKYFESFPTVKSYFASIVELSKEQGYVETLLGRRRYFDYATAVPMIRAAYERESVNTVFQGSAADLIKLSMNKIADVIKKRRLPAKMLLQIHDELIFEADAAEAEAVAQEFKAIMESIVALNVPLKTSLNLGRHWGELK